MSIISRIKPYSLPLTLVGAALLGELGHCAGKTSERVKNQVHIREALDVAKEQSAKSCRELYGRVATQVPELLRACEHGTQITVDNAKIAIILCKN